jgi:hypothetical protein
VTVLHKACQIERVTFSFFFRESFFFIFARLNCDFLIVVVATGN